MLFRSVGSEKDCVKATILNVKYSVAKIRRLIQNAEGLQIIGALYNTESGAVDFELDDLL